MDTNTVIVIIDVMIILLIAFACWVTKSPMPIWGLLFLFYAVSK